jgi:hypothetical protein
MIFFVTLQQSKFVNKMKSTIKPGDCVVLCNFAKNYSFILQDKAQGYDSNNALATVHPYTIYIKDNITAAVMYKNLRYFRLLKTQCSCSSSFPAALNDIY